MDTRGMIPSQMSGGRYTGPGLPRRQPRMPNKSPEGLAET